MQGCPRLLITYLGIGLLTLPACSVRSIRQSLPPTANSKREVISTHLIFDVSAMTALASITLGPSTAPGASLEIGDLVINSVQSKKRDVPFVRDGQQLMLALPASKEAVRVDIAYRWQLHDWNGTESFAGASSAGYTNTWPNRCGNLFPCHSDPADGSTFTLALTGVPVGQTAIYPRTIPTTAPAYQLAWSIGDYAELPLGATMAGTSVSIWHRGDEIARAQAGGAYLVDAFDWLERTLGSYRFGNYVGSVSVEWPLKSYGGIEHHPFWHVAATALDDPSIHIHEAAHGWFGDGVRLACWEDFVLSEGTATYLTARALSVVAPRLGTRTWQAYATKLAALTNHESVWPASCGRVDVWTLFNDAAYVRGAFFYKAVADRVGADLLDQALATFYRNHAGSAARMSDMLTTINDVTGYDASACADTWLRADTPQMPGPCP